MLNLASLFKLKKITNFISIIITLNLS